MTITIDTQSKRTHWEQAIRNTSQDIAHLLSLVEQEGDEQSLVSDIASQLTRLVMQRLPVTATSPFYYSKQTGSENTFAGQVSIMLTACLQQGLRRILLVPWGSKQATDALLEPVRFILSTMTGEAVSLTEIALPDVHVDGVSVRSGIEGLSSTQAQLSPLLTSFPGWSRTWLMLSAGQVKIILLSTSAWIEQPAQAAAWKNSTMKALTAALYPELIPARERSHWLRDGQIYAHYLVSLLSAASELLQRA